MRPLLRILLGAAAAIAALFLTTRAKDQELRQRRLYARTALMGGVQEAVSGAWRGGTVRSLFGGTELDLRHADLPRHGAILDVVILCGGVRLIVPPTWQVTVDGTPLMAGISNQHEGGDGPRLLVRVRLLFGGLRIDHGDPVRLGDDAWLDIEEE